MNENKQTRLEADNDKLQEKIIALETLSNALETELNDLKKQFNEMIEDPEGFSDDVSADDLFD
jgi:peptidoglycan hydrolase CwlO-like protein